MGYATNYSLTWEQEEGHEDKPRCNHSVAVGNRYCPECGKPTGAFGVDDMVSEYISSHDDISHAINEDGDTRDACKWYEHEADMREMSSEIPNVLFCLHGEGEEAGDLWNKYFLNGKMQVCKAQLVYDEFDKRKLK